MFLNNISWCIFRENPSIYGLISSKFLIENQLFQNKDIWTSNTMATPLPDLSEADYRKLTSKSLIRSVDMSLEMSSECMEVITMAVDKHQNTKNYEVFNARLIDLLYCFQHNLLGGSSLNKVYLRQEIRCFLALCNWWRFWIWYHISVQEYDIYVLWSDRCDGIQVLVLTAIFVLRSSYCRVVVFLLT